VGGIGEIIFCGMADLCFLLIFFNCIGVLLLQALGVLGEAKSVAEEVYFNVQTLSALPEVHTYLLSVLLKNKRIFCRCFT
jgi:hypothetical protein